MSNPLLTRDELPAFSRIEAAHVEPAVTELIARSKAAIEELLTGDDSGATWNSLCARLEELDDDLARCWAPVSHLNGVLNSDALREAYNACLPRLTAYHSWLGQHRELYDAHRAVAGTDATVDRVRGRRRALDNALRDFELAGVALAAPQRERFAALSERLASLSAQFSDNLLDATDAWTLAVTEAQLAGVPESTRAAARAAAGDRGGDDLLLTLDGPTYLAIMMHCEDRAVREAMYTAWNTRASDQGPHAGEWDNTAVMHDILACRREQATLLGYDNYAALSLTTKMADDTDTVLAFLADLATRARPQAEREWQELVAYARDEHGVDSLAAWDVPFFSERLRETRHAISQEELRPYLPLPKVLDALFELCGTLFGVEISEREDFDSYHPDVRLLELRRQGELLARCYLDLYARSGKRGGAWMADCRVRRDTSEGLQHPVAFLVCNFSPPQGERPCLLTHDELTTLFHEFGHGLHHMLTGQTVAAVSGINGVEWDAVELPSQFLENWCWQREFLARLGSHVDSGAALPAELIDRLIDARNFQAAMQTLRQLEFALFDFRLHLRWENPTATPVQAVLDEVRGEVAVVRPPPWNRFQHGFGHIFAGGYAAGYYAYKWAEVLSADAFARFEEEGIFNGDTGAAFRREVLEVGGSRDAMATFRAFRGREPDIGPLLRHSGIAA